MSYLYLPAASSFHRLDKPGEAADVWQRFNISALHKIWQHHLSFSFSFFFPAWIWCARWRNPPKRARRSTTGTGSRIAEQTAGKRLPRFKQRKRETKSKHNGVTASEDPGETFLEFTTLRRQQIELVHVDFSHARKQKAVTQVGPGRPGHMHTTHKRSLLCFLGPQPHCSLGVCVWVSTSSSCLHTPHRCRYRAYAKVAPPPLHDFESIARKTKLRPVYSDGGRPMGAESARGEEAKWKMGTTGGPKTWQRGRLLLFAFRFLQQRPRQ